MRKIKFRVWDKEKREMIFGGIEYELRLLEIDGPEYPADDADIGFSDWESEYFHVMQYTGVKDKNDVEIYEGDIVKARKPNSYLNGEYEVYFDTHYGCWAMRSTSSLLTPHIMHTARKSNGQPYILRQKDISVIGNVFETDD